MIVNKIKQPGTLRPKRVTKASQRESTRRTNLSKDLLEVLNDDSEDDSERHKVPQEEVKKMGHNF